MELFASVVPWNGSFTLRELWFASSGHVRDITSSVPVLPGQHKDSN